MLAHALEYASRGWPVFPLGGKRPRTEHGCKDATTDPSTIEAWWQKFPGANIGIATGRQSGLVVLDVDGDRGESYLEELQRRFGPLPTTLEARTRPGRRHLYFAYPDSAVVRNSESKIGEDIDVRGEGGYAVAPPSIHPETRRPYEWSNAEPVVRLPKWLLDSMTRGKTRARDSSIVIPEGTRNSSLAKIAGWLRRVGLNADEIELRLHEANLQRCVPSLSDAEVSAIARSIARYPPGSQNHVAVVGQEPTKRPAESSPAERVDAWPTSLGDAAYHGILGDLVKAIEPQTEADPAALLTQLLVMLGNVIGRTAHWCVEADTHYLNLNLALVGATGKGRKGTSASHARRVVDAVDPTWSDSRIQSGLSTGEGLMGMSQ